MLEPQVFRYRESYQFYYILGISCLRTGDYGGAFSYLRRSLSLKPLEENTLLGLSVVHLKREETQEAIRNWFSVLDNNPKNKIAERGLRYIKRMSEDGPASLFMQNRHLRLIPEQRVNPLPLIIGFAAGIIMVILSGIIISQAVKPAPNIRNIKIDLSLKKIEEIVQNPENATFILTEDEVKKTYRQAYRYFQQGKDNAARRELNRLMLSNASESIKTNAKIMIDHSRVPEFTSIDAEYSYNDVNSSPLIYEGCYIKWKGMISNLDINEERIAFDFLVGYHTREVLEGIVVCVSRIPFRPNNGEAFELLAQIVNTQEGFYLRLIAYHKILPEKK